jgi:hypothetical protein
MFPNKNSKTSLSIPKLSVLFLIYGIGLFYFLPATAGNIELEETSRTEVKFNYSGNIEEYCNSVDFKEKCLDRIKENRNNKGVFAYKYSNNNKYWYKRK